MKKVAIIHTTPVTVQSLTSLAKQKMPDVEIVNILDDSMLKDMIAKRNVEQVEKRWMTYVGISEMIGANAVLNACSTVGGFVKGANDTYQIPVYRIDEAMAIQAVERGKTICIFATLESTLNPTTLLIQEKAEQMEKDYTIQSHCIQGAYDNLLNGNKEEHDRLIKENVEKYIHQVDIVVLAQASMASALSGITEHLMDKVLTSPESGMEMLKDKMQM